MTKDEFLERIDYIMCGTSNAERAYLEQLYHDVTTPCWISVEDELPTEYGKYLVATKGNVVEVSLYDNDGWHNWSGGKTTHWAPRPEPPKKGGQL